MKKTVSWLLVLGALAVVVVGAPAVSEAAASNGITYGIEGTAAVSPSPFNYCTDVYGCPMSDSGTATLYPPDPIHPATGTFSVRWTITTFPPNPCKVKRLDGSLDVAWSDGTTSTATVSGRFVDGKSVLKFSGAVGATATSFSGYTVAGVFNGLPPNPCIAATSSITGGLTFFPPDSI
jgi:hypothetical protein